jgi:hypothetical protein
LSSSHRSPAHDARPTWHHPRILSLLILVFLCGAAAGALSMRVAGTYMAKPSINTWKESTREMTLDWFRRELDLTPEQAREIEAVLDDYVIYYQNLQTQMDDFRYEGKKRIMQILNEEQRRKYQSISGQMASGKLR